MKDHARSPHAAAGSTAFYVGIQSLMTVIGCQVPCPQRLKACFKASHPSFPTCKASVNSLLFNGGGAGPGRTMMPI